MTQLLPKELEWSADNNMLRGYLPGKVGKGKEVITISPQGFQLHQWTVYRSADEPKDQTSGLVFPLENAIKGAITFCQLEGLHGFSLEEKTITREEYVLSIYPGKDSNLPKNLISADTGRRLMELHEGYLFDGMLLEPHHKGEIRSIKLVVELEKQLREEEEKEKEGVS